MICGGWWTVATDQLGGRTLTAGHPVPVAPLRSATPQATAIILPLNPEVSGGGGGWAGGLLSLSEAAHTGTLSSRARRAHNTHNPQPAPAGTRAEQIHTLHTLATHHSPI